MVKKLLKTSPLLLFLTLCKSPTAEAHFLWKIESDPPSYLYGTVHSSDHSVRNLPAEVTDAVTASNSFHPEIEFSPENIGRITAATLAPLDKKTEWNLAPDLKKRIEKAAAEVGIPQILLQNIPLQILPLLLSAPPETDFNQIVDLQVYQLAKKQNLEIQQLETVDEQIGVFRNLSDADAIELLKELLEERENGFPAYRTTLQYYSRGELDSLMAFFNGEMKSSGFEKLERELLQIRNHRMAKRLQPFLEAGGAFAAVGVAHLPGEEGLIDLLRSNGWKISSVEIRRDPEQNPNKKASPKN